MHLPSLGSSLWFYCVIFSTVLCSTFAQPEESSKDVFDYIIMGGGTCGLVIASRLSENPNITVLVLEAGGHIDDKNPKITVPAFTGQVIGSPIDWNYTSIPLKDVNRRLILPRGKVLGGTSVFNSMLSVKSSRLDYDTVEHLGNIGWGWSEFDRGSKKSEKFLFPQSTKNLSFVTNYHGRNGPVKTSLPVYFPPAPAGWISAVRALGHAPTPIDTFGGNLSGPYHFPSTIDENFERMTSAKAYYYPIASRSNLVVRIYCEVDKLKTHKSKDGKVIVKSVQYTSDGSVKEAVARQEFILSAGIYGSPAILERSGMGDPAILDKLEIPIVNKLVGVGANLGDHIQALNTYQLAPGLVSTDNLTTNATFAAEQSELYKTRRQGILTYTSSLLDYEPLHAILTKEEIAEGSKLLETSWPHLPARTLEAVKKQIREGTPIEYQIWDKRPTWVSGPLNASYISIFAALQYPFSRGSSHISSRDPSMAPLIDAGYFTHPFDVWLLAKGAKHIRDIMNQPSMKVAISSEFFPGPNVNSEEEWREYARTTVRSFHHQTGTIAMLPFEDGGVVDPNLRVYGTTNLRAIDSSIIPIPLAMHNQMTVYAIGELGAEKILQSRSSW